MPEQEQNKEGRAARERPEREQAEKGGFGEETVYTPLSEDARHPANGVEGRDSVEADPRVAETGDTDDTEDTA
jgi:hypothetical protein